VGNSSLQQGERKLHVPLVFSVDVLEQLSVMIVYAEGMA
jgi:hypothetical protein